MKIQIKTFWPAIIGLVVATALFCLPGKELPNQDWFAAIFLDKWIHVGLFVVLVVLSCLPLLHRIDDLARVRNLFSWITLGFIVYGAGIEFVQENFIQYRTFGVDDMVANAIGCAIGFLFVNRQLKNQKHHR